MTLTATARCHVCGVLAEGDPKTCDKASIKHTALDHPTAVMVQDADYRKQAGR